MNSPICTKIPRRTEREQQAWELLEAVKTWGANDHPPFQLKRLLAEWATQSDRIEELEQLLGMKREFDEMGEDGCWEGDHPIVALAAERDAFLKKLAAVRTELSDLATMLEGVGQDYAAKRLREVLK